MLADLEYPYIPGVNFISGSKIILDFDRKSLAIPDPQIDKVVKTNEEANLEIDLSKTGLEERHKQELQDLCNSFKGLLSDKPGLTLVDTPCCWPGGSFGVCRLNCWEQWTREGTHARKTGSGATRKTTRRDDRMIVRQALVDPTVTCSTIRADVGVEIVPQTISRHLAEANLKSKRPFRALSLTPEHRQLRLQWCQARSMWNVTGWQKIVFSVNPGLFWGHMITVYGCGGALQDNARSHTARVAQDILRHFHILPWQARSPNLSPVEHMCDQLKRQIPSCHSVHDLELAVQDLWAHLPQNNIKCLINSMPDRVAACIAAGGGPTRYWSCPVFVSLHILYSFNCLVFGIK
ncbi:transposable element Tc1 transposase [Trichonephila clavipes]|nr:transposable element Tc1 transposase [Trichonephila clavipes]